MRINYYVHVYNKIHKCVSVEKLYKLVKKIYEDTNEYSEIECEAMASMIKTWAELIQCPSIDMMNYNGMVITTECVYPKNIKCYRKEVQK